MAATPVVRSCVCTMVHQYNELKEFLAPVFESIRAIVEATFEQRLLLAEIMSDPVELICETNEEKMLELFDKLKVIKELYEYVFVRLAMCFKHWHENGALAVAETAVNHNLVCTIETLRSTKADIGRLLAENQVEHVATVGLMTQIEELFAEHSSDALEAREESQRMRIHVL